MKHRRIPLARITIAMIAIFLIALLPVACDDPTNAGERADVSLSMALHKAGLIASPTSARVNDARQELVLTNVDLALAGATLERADDDDEGDDDEDAEADDDEDAEGDDDDDDEVVTGPLLVNLPVNGGMISPVTAPIPRAQYDEIELEVDRARLHGSFDGQLFDVTIPVNREVDRRFRPPLRIDSNDDRTNTTVSVRAAEWFRGRNGALVDPRRIATDPQLLAEVQRRIAASLRAFEDPDRDGYE